MSQNERKLVAIGPNCIYRIDIEEETNISLHVDKKAAFSTAAISPDSRFLVVVETYGRMYRFELKTLELQEKHLHSKSLWGPSETAK